MIRQRYDKYLLNNFFTAEGLFCTPPGARRINWHRGWRRRALSRNGIHIFIHKTKRKRNGTTYYNKYFRLSKNKFCLWKIMVKSGQTGSTWLTIRQKWHMQRAPRFWEPRAYSLYAGRFWTWKSQVFPSVLSKIILWDLTWCWYELVWVARSIPFQAL
jgi:hypothetical protein